MAIPEIPRGQKPIEERMGGGANLWLPEGFEDGVVSHIKAVNSVTNNKSNTGIDESKLRTGISDGVERVKSYAKDNNLSVLPIVFASGGGFNLRQAITVADAERPQGVGKTWEYSSWKKDGNVFVPELERVGGKTAGETAVSWTMSAIVLPNGEKSLKGMMQGLGQFFDGKDWNLDKFANAEGQPLQITDINALSERSHSASANEMFQFASIQRRITELAGQALFGGYCVRTPILGKDGKLDKNNGRLKNAGGDSPVPVVWPYDWSDRLAKLAGDVGLRLSHCGWVRVDEVPKA